MSETAEIYQAIIDDPANAKYTAQGIKPLFQIEPQATILIASQAPSRKAQATMTFWNDQSGDRLRDWMGVSRETFYQSHRIAVLPVDFYYPGKGKHGDLPPRKTFADKWHAPLLALMPQIQLTLVIGQYAQAYYLGKQRRATLTETVAHYHEYLPNFPLVHPSPLTYGWFHRNPWFEMAVLPDLKRLVADALI